MTPTVTLELIEEYEKKLQKNQITPDNLPPCSRCLVESQFFKTHAFRERRFLVIIEMMIQAVFSALVRFKCPGCGKTFTYYPEFAIPHKHYVQPVITDFSNTYVESDEMTYKQAVMVDNQAPGYPDDKAILSPSTIHRWVGSLGEFSKTRRTALAMLSQEDPGSNIFRDIARVKIPARKYRSRRREKLLIGCRSLMIVQIFFLATFTTSIFTKLAISCAFR